MSFCLFLRNARCAYLSFALFAFASRSREAESEAKRATPQGVRAAAAMSTQRCFLSPANPSSSLPASDPVCVCVCTDVKFLRKPARFPTSVLPSILQTVISRRRIRRGLTFCKSPSPSPYVVECSGRSLKEGRNRGWILR